MANEKSNRNSSGRAATKHTALGRGLGALIPSQIVNDDSATSSGASTDPLDVLFPGRPSGARLRGGSAKDLLTPKSSGMSRTRKSAKVTSSTSSDVKSKQKQGRDEKKEMTASSVISSSASSLSSTADIAPESVEISTYITHKEADSKLRVESGRKEVQTHSPVSATPLHQEKGSSDKVEITLGTDADSSELKDQQLSSSESAFPKKDGESASSNANVSRETSQDLLPVPGATFADIPIDYIVPNTRQPREVFDEDDLAELRDSILEVGVLQPIVVRPIDFEAEHSPRLVEYMKEKPKARFELIMGERRLRASELAGFETVPSIIRQTEDEDLLRDALLENLHRAQLNPLEEASAYQQLMADFGATQEQLAKRIARSRPQIANTLRLLKLPPAVQKKVAAQVISAGHARALLSLKTAQEMEILAERIVAEGLSVRTTEELVRLGRVKSVSRSQRTPRVATLSALGESVVCAFENLYETRVTITEGAKKGKIVIEFAGQEDLERIKDLVMRQH